MAIAGLILGILGLIGGWIPVINYFAWAFPLVGVILSAIALKKAKAAGQPTGVAIAGLVLSIIGLSVSFIALLCTVICIGAAVGAASSLGW